MSHCTCDYHQEQNKSMKKIENLHHGMQTENIISSSSGLDEIIDAVNSLIDAHNEMVEEKEIIKNMVACREKLAEVDKKYNNL